MTVVAHMATTAACQAASQRRADRAVTATAATTAPASAAREYVRYATTGAIDARASAAARSQRARESTLNASAVARVIADQQPSAFQ